MNQPYVYICPLPLETPSHLPPHPTLLGCHIALGLSFLCHSASYHWLSALHMVMRMFQCHFLNSSHPLLPSLCTQVFSLCLHLHCCPANRFISTIFLDSTYMCVNMWYLFFSFWPTSLCIIDSRFTYLIRTDFDVFLFPTTYPQCGAFFLGGSFESSFSAPSDLTAHYLNHLQLRVGRPLHFWVVVLK